MELGTTPPQQGSLLSPSWSWGGGAGASEASNASSVVLTLEESLFDLLFIKLCILNALLEPKCWEGGQAFVSAPFWVS